MGTTVVSAYFSPNNQRVYIAHVGDSRCYRLRPMDDEQDLGSLTMRSCRVQAQQLIDLCCGFRIVGER